MGGYYFVYIIGNKNLTTFYTGVTNDLERRMLEHKHHFKPKSFSARYNLEKLLYYEDHQDIDEAIYREKQIKNWRRQWKLNLISENNHLFLDLSADWEY